MYIAVGSLCGFQRVQQGCKHCCRAPIMRYSVENLAEKIALRSLKPREAGQIRSRASLRLLKEMSRGALLIPGGQRFA